MDAGSLADVKQQNRIFMMGLRIVCCPGPNYYCCYERESLTVLEFNNWEIINYLM